MNTSTTELLNELAIKFGTTIEHLWSILVRQSYIDAGSLTAGSILFAIVTYKLFKWVKFNVSEEEGSAEWCDEGQFFGFAAVAIVGGITALLGGSALQAILVALFNPEFYALKQLL